MTTKPWALGLHSLLLDAIYRHAKADPERRLPRRIELPFALFDEFRVGVDLRHVAWPTCAEEAYNVVRWHGVDVHGVDRTNRPKLITANNEIEYLAENFPIATNENGPKKGPL